MKPDWGRIGGFLITFALGGIAAWLAADHLQNSQELKNYLVTFFSILAGFIVAIMSLVADPKGLEHRSWSALEMERVRIKVYIRRQQFLFILYLIALLLLLTGTVLSQKWPQLAWWADLFTVWVGTWALLLSLALPWQLARIHMDRYDRIIEEKRREVGIKD